MKIFLSYRHQDNNYIAGLIRDKLAHAFGSEQVFRDLQNIPSGVDHKAFLEREIRGSHVMLVLIDPQWTSITDAHGNKRLFNPQDPTRIEVESGLKREDIFVIPVLIEGAAMPSIEDLPEQLAKLVYRNAISIRNFPDFDIDVERLIRGISRFGEPPEQALRVFLCHASQDKPTVRELYERLLSDGIDAWLDEEKLLPGQDRDSEIKKAVKNSDAVIVCMSKNAVSKEGYIQKELRFILDIGLEKPDGTIFIIPIRLDDCQVPARLQPYHYIDYFPHDNRFRAYDRIRASLEIRGRKLAER